MKLSTYKIVGVTFLVIFYGAVIFNVVQSDARTGKLKTYQGGTR